MKRKGTRPAWTTGGFGWNQSRMEQDSVGTNIKAVSWNIAGSKKMIEVWDWLKGYDIIALQETWTEKKDENKVISRLSRDFKWIMKSATRKCKRGRAMGGQIVGLRKSLFGNVICKEWKDGIVCEGIKLGEEEPFTMITVYNNCGFKKLEAELEKMVITAEEKNEYVLLIGDMNARVGKEQGKLGGGGTGICTRSSKDSVKNGEGKRLMNLCDRKGLLVMNGRCEGDWEGGITYVGDNEGSVLDYVIISEGKEHILKEIKTEIRLESDHLPVSFYLRRKGGEREEGRGKDGADQQSKEIILVWKDEARLKFEEEFGKSWSQNATVEGARDRWDRLIQIIKEAAGKAGMTKVRGGPTRGRKKMDEGIREQRGTVWKKLKDYIEARNRNEGKREREAFVEARRELKKIREEKSREEWEEKWNRVENCENIAGLWEAIKPFKPKRAAMGKQISKKEWVEHFGKLLGGGEPQGGYGARERSKAYKKRVGTEIWKTLTGTLSGKI